MNRRIFTGCFALITAALLIVSVSCGNTGKADKVQLQAQQVNMNPSFSSFLSQQQFNAFFPKRLSFYTYASFIKAVDEMANIKIKITQQSDYVFQIIRTDKDKNKQTILRQDGDWNKPWVTEKPAVVHTIDFGRFCNEKDAATNKKELVAFFANVGHETRKGENAKYNDGLMLITEGDTSLQYVYPNNDYPAVPGKKYYGRGPLQLSYNGNYGYASLLIYGDKNKLLKDPELLERDAVAAFKAAMFFWMTPQGQKPSAHDVMTGQWKPTADDTAKGRKPGFGMTINIINGALECNKGDAKGTMADRIGFYQHFLGLMGIADPNCACSCGSMHPYPF
ncbi:chitinase [Mucilaginibacter myungsuensis]|uniref:Glycoside hydrolase family 19 catalytic domain-containing protein n=1 Tax=Mucilaginibacter myungsuensis TaxID=649104 RepID=A0A929L272_9SPHI|nr:chitinase [Mucilaginibacter myungsuensis]MBE9664268.1 hypothetical protein [Mucilaginibacter myungsuensis]MDN3599972.1 chitinase [Mucilaginibacter myungsuensis]